MIERVFILKRTEVFKGLPSDVLASFAGHLEELYVAKDETIFEKGDIGKSMYIIMDGLVRIHDGDETLIELGPDQVFGEMTVLTAEVRTASATALEETRLLRLDQDMLYEVMAGRPAVSKGIIKVLVERLQ